MKIELPKKVLFIINNLQLHGYEAFAVGGCVRDSILARRPQDWDITTSAKPEEIKKLFRRTIDTGIEHGTVTVLFGKDSFEVTTYRIDGAYEDSRHPKEVQFTNRLEEDLRRRDFTINAMAYNDQVRLVDVFGGMQDLNHHTLRYFSGTVLPDKDFRFASIGGHLPDDCSRWYGQVWTYSN